MKMKFLEFSIQLLSWGRARDEKPFQKVESSKITLHDFGRILRHAIRRNFRLIFLKDEVPT